MNFRDSGSLQIRHSLEDFCCLYVILGVLSYIMGSNWAKSTPSRRMMTLLTPGGVFRGVLSYPATVTAAEPGAPDLDTITLACAGATPEARRPVAGCGEGSSPAQPRSRAVRQRLSTLAPTRERALPWKRHSRLPNSHFCPATNALREASPRLLLFWASSFHMLHHYSFLSFIACFPVHVKHQIN